MRARLVPVCVLILCSFVGNVSMAMAGPLPEPEVNQCKLEKTGPAKAELPVDVLETAIFQAISCSSVADCPCPAPACTCTQASRCICNFFQCGV